MAIIRFNRPNSGSEMTLKILSVITEEVNLKQGRILLSSSTDGEYYSTKASLFLDAPIVEYVGYRNVWLRDKEHGLLLTFADYDLGKYFLEQLHLNNKWERSLPSSHQKFYSFKDLEQAADDIRDYLLYGNIPDLIFNKKHES